MRERAREKLNSVLRKAIATPPSTPVRSDMASASLVRKLRAASATPPEVENTSGQKLPFS